MNGTPRINNIYQKAKQSEKKYMRSVLQVHYLLESSSEALQIFRSPAIVLPEFLAKLFKHLGVDVGIGMR